MTQAKKLIVSAMMTIVIAVSITMTSPQLFSGDNIRAVDTVKILAIGMSLGVLLSNLFPLLLSKKTT